jgi:anti-sigma factor RsiW
VSTSNHKNSPTSDRDHRDAGDPSDWDSGDWDAGDWALMRHLDGELDPDRAKELDALLAGDETARDKAAGLALVAELLRERVDADARADGIVDAVMARLDEAPSDESEAEPVKAAPSSGRVATDRPANDNARIIFTLATAAAAVAAGLFFWGTTEPDDGVALAPPAEPPAELAPLPTFAEEAPATAEVEAEEAPQPVEVAAVDFGSQSGSVFYVSGQNAATAVVWVTGGEEP